MIGGFFILQICHTICNTNTYETPPVVKTRKKSLISKENNSITVALYIVSVFDG